MPLTLKNVKLWSKEAKALVSWKVSLEEETDEGGNVSKVVMLRYNKEIHRFSPNTTDADLERIVPLMNDSKE